MNSSQQDQVQEIDSSNQRRLIIRKTKYSDIYELYLDGITPVEGNNVAYIPSLDVSKKMRELFKTRMSFPLTCSFDTLRQKWIPVIE